MTTNFRTSVLVVGGGPVGLSSAMELKYHGVPTIVVEPREWVSFIRPRAKTTSARTMEFYRRWGFADTVRAIAPMHIDWAKDIVFCTTLTGHEITRLKGALGLHLFQHELSAEAGQQVPQPIVEQAMREVLEASEKSTLLLGWSAVDLEQHADGVIVTIENADGERKTIEAEYVVGADGPRSIVREAIGAAYEGSSLPRPNISITFESAELEKIVPHGNAVQYWILNPASPGIIGRLDLENTWWAISTARPLAEGEPEADPEVVVHELIGRDVPVRVIATDPWKARTLIADRYRSGRLFIAGDAAHQNPPWGGHGYNTGVGDAINLGWKLAAVLNGWAPSELLDSYQSERRPVAETFVAAAAENGKFGPMALGTPELMGDDAQFAEAQVSVAAGVQFAKRIEFHSDGLVFGLGYGGNADEQTTNGSDYLPIAAPGNRLPHKWLTRTESLFDRLGKEFTVIGAAEDTATLLNAANDRGVPLATLDDPSLGLAAFFGAKIVLVRPDEHIAWMGDVASADEASGILGAALRGFQPTPAQVQRSTS